LRNARIEQRSPAFKRLLKLRQAVEHRIARLSQLGMRQARYIGRTKTLFQLLLTATVANLTLIASAEACRRIFVLVTLYIALWIRSIALQITQEARRWIRGIITLTNGNQTSTLLKTGGSCPGL
jgi:hypothetical protein